MKKWESEDQIKTKLRELTDATRRLRRDLDDMMRGSEVKPEDRYRHHQSWPSATAPDRSKKKKAP